VAVLQLIEQEKLKLDDRVFEVLDYNDAITAAGETFDVRLRNITIRHLLEHRAGWDRDKSFDAMFESVRFAREAGVEAPANADVVIRAMLSQPLDFEPGERYAYSNFGYCLLGRVIEKISGQPYENYVQDKVLAPAGITTMHIGASRLQGRREKEVRYYQPGSGKSVFQEDLDQMTPWPYGGWNLEAMDAHGGWIASASDIARFASSFDDREHCLLLKPDTIDLMYQRPPGLAGQNDDGTAKDVYYSLGWQNRVFPDGKVNHWHTGSLPGTTTFMARLHDGRTLVGLLNTRVSPSATPLARALELLLHHATAPNENP
jgi:N-acyl-D-amino-acid deacylase